jgi:4,5-DOPA dioxygenase extradiol
MTDSQKIKSARMPVLFVGHGSPMNAIENNSYTKMLKALGEKIPRPKAILVISAHWMTKGTWVLGMDKPKTIHDFHGFPKELYDVQYPAPGKPQVAQELSQIITQPKIGIDQNGWGLDHGTWSVLRHMYPLADVPVLQLSLDLSQPPEYHFHIGQQLAKLRDEGVLILGSGNLVHNLHLIDWNTYAKPFAWASEYDLWLKDKLMGRDFSSLKKDFLSSEAGRLSNPTVDHFLPVHYILGASDSKDELKFEFEEIHHASISMRTFGFWAS